VGIAAGKLSWRMTIPLFLNVHDFPKSKLDLRYFLVYPSILRTRCSMTGKDSIGSEE
jgi:hypothetical protein